MAIVMTDSRHYMDLANIARERGCTSESFTPEQLPDAIRAACDRQFADGMAAAYTVRSGTFMPSADTNKLHLSIPGGAQMIEIIPEGTPSETASTSRMPVHYVLALAPFQEHNPAYKDLGAMVQYYYNSRYYTSHYAYDVADGFDVKLATGLVFEANMTYTWTAHYW